MMHEQDEYSVKKYIYIYICTHICIYTIHTYVNLTKKLHLQFYVTLNKQ